MPSIKKSRSKPRSPSLKAANAKLLRENKELRRKLQERNRDLTEAQEQQTATGEILRVIASSPTDTSLANHTYEPLSNVAWMKLRYQSYEMGGRPSAGICSPARPG